MKFCIHCQPFPGWEPYPADTCPNHGPRPHDGRQEYEPDDTDAGHQFLVMIESLIALEQAHRAGEVTNVYYTARRARLLSEKAKLKAIVDAEDRRRFLGR